MKMTGLLGGGFGQGSGTGPVDFVNSPEQEPESNVAPEEQQQYDLFVKNAMELIYREEGVVQPEILKRLSTGGKRIDALAQTAVWLVMLVEADAQRNNMNIEDDVIFHAGSEIVEQLVEVAEAAGIHEFKEAEIQGAWYQALDMYREANSDEDGRFNPEEAAGAFELLNEAEKEGRGDEVLPGFSQTAERAMAMAMMDENPVDDEEDPDAPSRLNPRDLGRG